MVSDDSPKGASEQVKERPRIRYFRLRNKLKDKASGGMGGGSGSGEISAELLEKAMAEVQKVAEDYPDWVKGYISELAGEHSAALDKRPTERVTHFKHISEMAHELRGQGGTFGYPLISVFGKSLYGFTGPGAVYSDSHLEIVKAHIDSMRVVINDRIEGDGGRLGLELSKGLQVAIAKHTKVEQEPTPAKRTAKPAPKR